MQDPKLLALLDVVIDNYISKWDPVWSKFLNSLEEVDYAPSTLRKYLNLLEQAGLVYQPYNSSGRIPTVDGLSTYIQSYLDNEHNQEEEIEIQNARKWIKYLVENLGGIVDGVVVWFLRNDEYYYLWMNNLLRDDLRDEYDTTRYIIKFIEDRSIVKYLDGKIIKKNKVYYTFVENKGVIVSCLYAKVTIDDYEVILSIVWPSRVDYKRNVAVLNKVIDSLG